MQPEARVHAAFSGRTPGRYSHVERPGWGRRTDRAARAADRGPVGSQREGAAYPVVFGFHRDLPVLGALNSPLGILSLESTTKQQVLASKGWLWPRSFLSSDFRSEGARIPTLPFRCRYSWCWLEDEPTRSAPYPRLQPCPLWEPNQGGPGASDFSHPPRGNQIHTYCADSVQRAWSGCHPSSPIQVKEPEGGAALGPSFFSEKPRCCQGEI